MEDNMNTFDKNTCASIDLLTVRPHPAQISPTSLSQAYEKINIAWLNSSYKMKNNTLLKYYWAAFGLDDAGLCWHRLEWQYHKYWPTNHVRQNAIWTSCWLIYDTTLHTEMQIVMVRCQIHWTSFISKLEIHTLKKNRKYMCFVFISNIVFTLKQP